MKTVAIPLACLLAGVFLGVVANRQGIVGGRAADEGGADGLRVRTNAGARTMSVSGAVLNDLLKGRSVQEMNTEEVYRLLQSWFEMDSHSLEGARINHQVRLLMEKLPPAMVEQVLDRCRENEDSLRYVRDLFTDYALRDWDKALAWVSRQPDALYLRTAAFGTVAESDPDRVAAVYHQALLDGLIQDGEDIAVSLGKHHARQGLTAYFKFIDTLTKKSSNRLHFEIWDDIPKDQMPAFLAEFQKRSEAGEREMETDHLMDTLNESHPEIHQKWMEGLTPERRASEQLSLALRHFRTGKSDEKRALLEQAMAVAPDQAKGDLQHLIRVEPELARELMEMLPEGQKLTPEDMGSWHNSHMDEPAELFDNARLLRAPEDQAEYLIRSLTTFNRNTPLNQRDFEIISRRLDSSGLTGDPAARTKAALEEARKRVLEKK